MAGANGNPIHGIKRKGFYERKWFSELLSAGPPAIGACVASFKAYHEVSLPPWVFWGAVISFVWLFIASVVKVAVGVKQDKADDEARSHDGLRGALHVLHASVAKAGGLSNEEKDQCLRVTFHRVVPPLDDCDDIEQITPYVGGSWNGAGRKFRIRSGITGKAIRDNAVFTMDRQSESFEDYKRQLISDWGYTEADARTFTSDRFSLMAVPVTSTGGHAVLGVVYLDCRNKNFFASEAVQSAVLNGCAGIVRYTGERYV